MVHHEPKRADLVQTPSPGIDPLGALTASIYDSPRLYAFLIGSGVSTGARQPSAWEILDQLIAQYASATSTDVRALGLTPTEWWQRTFESDAEYSSVLERLEPTRGGRQQRLEKLFISSSPSDAHRHLAKLCSIGHVQVIMTTNFDRLIEDALTEQAVRFHVVDHNNVKGMQPLVRGAVTVIKLNGDYADLYMKNTRMALSHYTRPFTTLIKRVLQEYGLVVVGWSGRWDEGLRKLIESNSARLYPMYWVAHHGQLHDEAQRLLDQRGAYRIDSHGADDFFGRLATGLERLSQLAYTRARPIRALRGGRVFTISSNWSPVSSPSTQSGKLWIRTAVTLMPASQQGVGYVDAAEMWGYIDTPERRAIRTELAAARAAYDIASLVTVGQLNSGLPVDMLNQQMEWHLSKTDQLDRDSVYFELDAPKSDYCTCSARCRVYLGPGRPEQQGSAIIDIGIGDLKDRSNRQRKLALGELAIIWLDQLDAAIRILTDALSSATGGMAMIDTVEFHLEYLGKPDEPSMGLAHHVDFSLLGVGGRDARAVSSKFRPAEPLTGAAKLDIVIDAVRDIAMNTGFHDPDIGIGRLRSELDSLPRQA
ncbi:hypothetical protein Afer_1888 [Acidimicrobium ferrooxidans DSM 10331]|uniref:Uncharacterized protein n=1 Tax=Acidimicrobium ferrooxidans (strain DSM 10331 / JCM 15462 / NBRC 103882 / ICP) TaxID=525909 RepID=C7M1Q2_ACIFD|nr:hypothetical protein Afer_1888 [Acidimicrobium ferrooxidans DSM 10331]